VAGWRSGRKWQPKTLHPNWLQRLELPAKCPFFMAGWRAGCNGPSYWRAGLAGEVGPQVFRISNFRFGTGVCARLRETIFPNCQSRKHFRQKKFVSPGTFSKGRKNTGTARTFLFTCWSPCVC
jgi:hypothetical protein